MLQFFSTPNIDFVGRRRIWVTISLVFFVASLVFGLARGYNFNIDYTGGLELQYRFAQPMSEGQLRDALGKAGVSAEVTTLRSEDMDHPDWMIKLQQTTDPEVLRTTVDQAFAASFPGNAYELRSMHNIGPRVGKELKTGAIWATIWTSILLIIYVSVRFEFIYSVGAIIAVLHDVFVVLLFFSVFRWEFSLSVLAAILTLVGYSINDTIVVYDRIREQVKKQRGAPYAKVVNDAINQTLSRTILTGTTTIVSVIILIFFGGQTLTTMAVALLIGILTGTYSSIFIAAPILIEWHDRRATKLALSK